jgi:hypothetical protein
MFAYLKVINVRGEFLDVPSILLVFPPPDKQSFQEVDKYVYQLRKPLSPE